MATERQIQANRKNALRSTGPRTRAGKATVRFNALKHGLLAEAALIPGEDEGAFLKLLESLYTELDPSGEVEQFLVDRIASCIWRLKRVTEVEAGMFARSLHIDAASRARADAERCIERTDFESERRRERENDYRVLNGPRRAAALRRQREANRAAEGRTCALGSAFSSHAAKGDSFSKLGRYEARIERTLYHAHSELQKLQAARRQAEGNRDIAALPPGSQSKVAMDDQAVA